MPISALYWCGAMACTKCGRRVRKECDSIGVVDGVCGWGAWIGEFVLCLSLLTLFLFRSQLTTKGPARIDHQDYGDDNIYDMGACTVPQLLFGYDAALETKIEEYGYYNNDDDNIQDNDDYASYRDGKNPCLNDPNYYNYLQYGGGLADTNYDFVVLNDNTRAPARQSTREQSLYVLENVWADYFLESGATPIFIATYGYWTPYRDMSGLDSVSNFTSLTYNGYQEYAALLEEYLPPQQQPRIAKVGHAFLLVYEENYQLWERMFHVDSIHASPLGTYLQGLCVYYAIYGKMPLSKIAFQSAPSNMWQDARRFQPGQHRRSEFPTADEAHYLYNVATRVMRYNVVPETFIDYSEPIAADFEPNDDLYRVDDIFRP